MWLIYIPLGFALAYLGLVFAVSLGQTKLLFPTELAAANRPPSIGSGERLELRTPDGSHLVGIRLGDENGGSRPLLLGFGGNAWNAEVMAAYLHNVFPNREIIVFHYRGYPPSEGRPSAQALLEDSVSIFDHIRQSQSQRPIVAVGFSLGSGVAAYLARHRPVAGMILVTPYDTLENLAREHFPWAPVSLLLRHRIATIDFVRSGSTPTALIAAENDTIVPARRSDPLKRAIPNLVFGETIAQVGHNDLYHAPAFIGAMREALLRIEKASGNTP